MASPVISLINVYKQYGSIDAVSDVSAIITQGEIVGFIGPNGAGKTTTISMILGYIAPTKGSVRLFGKTVTPANAHIAQTKLGYASGDMVLPGHLTGAQYLAFITSRQPRHQKVYDMLCRRLSPQLDQAIGKLSRGNKQKIALIAALQHDPELLVLDEPTSGLDPFMQQTFLDVITDYANKGRTVLMSSHILSEVAELSSRVMFLRSGKLIVDKPIESILPKHSKRAVITTNAPQKLAESLPPLFALVTSTPTDVTVGIDAKDIKLFLRWLSTKPYDNLSIHDRELDDVFNDMYKGEI